MAIARQMWATLVMWMGELVVIRRFSLRDRGHQLRAARRRSTLSGLKPAFARSACREHGRRVAGPVSPQVRSGVYDTGAEGDGGLSCLADGTTKPISEIEVGDEVLAYDPDTGERGPREVTHLWVHRDTLVDLEVGESPITTTEDHPFWNVTDRAWQPAVELDTGDLVLTAGGGTLRVDGLDWSTTSVGTAYNLTVDGIHTYFVQAGSEEILVHNTCPGVGGLAGEFDADELAQLTYQHVGAGDIAGRPSLLEIETAINRATPVRLPGQNAVQFEHNGVRVIINEDIPTRSTAYYPGG
jgi:hypothetical protein